MSKESMDKKMMNKGKLALSGTEASGGVVGADEGGFSERQRSGDWEIERKTRGKTGRHGLMRN